ncbi:hypothetical protein B0H19DRAFT_1066991 [Mycena capillaripes]|nr:hypothetical protein B0H19DRAFT_1066991 [Mycena capillaripes]
MAPQPWSTPEQRTFLDSWMPDFIKRQAEGKLTLFWAPLLEAWFRRWPEHTLLGLPMPNDRSARPLTVQETETLGAAIVVRKGRLENYFRNNRRKIGNANTPGGASASTSTGATGLALQNLFLQNAPKRRRAHQPIEVFQKHNKAAIREALDEAGYNTLNEEKMADDVDDWADESEDTAAARIKATKSERMCLRTRVVQALWAEASVEEREAVEAEVTREKLEIYDQEIAADRFTASGERTPAQFQEAIDALDGILAHLHKATYNASGWVGMTIVGGPNPRHDGELSFKIACFGKTPAGNDFEESCVDFDKNIAEPFEAFLRSSFSPKAPLTVSSFTALEQRASRALAVHQEPSEPRLIRANTVDDEANTTALPKVKKPKCMTKPKKTKKQESPESSANTVAPPMDPNPPPTEPPPSTPSTPSGPMPFDEFDAYIDGLDLDMLGDSDAQFSTTPDMPPPLTRGTAAALDLFERGMSERAPLPSSPLPWTSTQAATMNVDGFNFPVIQGVPPSPPPRSFPEPPLLLRAFSPGGAKTTTPLRPSPMHAPPTIVSSTLRAFHTPGFATRIARAMASLIAPPSSSVMAPSPGATAAKTPIAPVSTPAVPPTYPESRPPARTPAAPGSTPAMPPTFPESRPPAKTPVAPGSTSTANAVKPPPAVKKTGKAAVTTGKKKVAVVRAGTKELAAKAALVTEVKRGRGRPKKTAVLHDGTNTQDAAPAEVANPAAGVAPALVSSITNNNRRYAKLAQQQEEVAKKKEAAEALAKQSAKGWITAPNPAGEHDLVILTRARKPTVLADGSAPTRQVKNTRKPNPMLSKTEVVLLARAAATKKRTAAMSVSAPKAKKARNA